MRLKTLKELVDEFGGRLIIDTDGFFYLDNTESTPIKSYYLRCLGMGLEAVGLVEADVPDWAIKKPEKRKLYAFIDGNGEVTFGNEEKVDKKLEFPVTRAPQFDLEFDND